MAIVSMDSYEEEDKIEPCIINKIGSVVQNEVIELKSEEEYIEIVNTDKQLDNIINYIEGEEWVVDYYLQVITKNDEIERFDPNLPDTAVQYTLLKQLVLFVDSPLTQDTASNLSGGAIINAGVVPNQGDVFVATLMGKRKAILRVESVNKKSYNLNNVYLVEYKVDMFIDSNKTVLDSLNDKVIKTFYYDREFIKSNGTPLLLEEKYRRKRQINSELEEMKDYYLKNMFNSERSVLAIPGQEFVVVDLMMQEFIFKITNTNDSDIINRITRLSVNDEYIKQPTVLDAILNRDVNILKTCNKKFSTVSAGSFSHNPHLRTIVYLGIGYIIYPSDIDIDYKDPQSALKGGPTYSLQSCPNKYGGDANINDNLIPKFSVDNEYYIFTEAFYNDDAENMSLIEGLVRMYLLNEVIDTRLLISLIDDYKYWDKVEQFYYIPILIILLRDAVNRSFSVN